MTGEDTAAKTLPREEESGEEESGEG